MWLLHRSGTLTIPRYPLVPRSDSERLPPKVFGWSFIGAGFVRTNEMENPTLYERLGGRESIAAVVDSFYGRVLDDDRLAHFFEGTDMQRQRAHQTQFLSSIAGGPVEYTGGDMESVHADLDISSGEFDAIATHLDRTLREFDVDDTAREDVVDAFYGYEDAIVTAA